MYKFSACTCLIVSPGISLLMAANSFLVTFISSWFIVLSTTPSNINVMGSYFLSVHRILNYPAEMTREEVRSSIYKAFQVWSNVAPLRFYEVQSGYAHMYLDFGTYNHGDLYPFDGPSGTLAHAFLPKSGFGELEGDVHFDDSEYFTFAGGEYSKLNF